jgi:hypothetical protein
MSTRWKNEAIPSINAKLGVGSEYKMMFSLLETLCLDKLESFLGFSIL